MHNVVLYILDFFSLIISNNFLLEDAVIGKFINLSVIGYCKDEAKDRIFLFLTNYTDGTLDQSGFPTGDRTVIDGKGNTQFVKGSACSCAFCSVNDNHSSGER